MIVVRSCLAVTLTRTCTCTKELIKANFSFILHIAFAWATTAELQRMAMPTMTGARHAMLGQCVYKECLVFGHLAINELYKRKSDYHGLSSKG